VKGGGGIAAGGVDSPFREAHMLEIHKRIVVDENGEPQEVLIPWKEFKEIEEALGLDLDAEAVADLEQARSDRAAGKPDAYLDLDDV
jgi:PHD/YefM family antitoxin component YafN of YafNO toxin-antitoxin module